LIESEIAHKMLDTRKHNGIGRLEGSCWIFFLKQE